MILQATYPQDCKLTTQTYEKKIVHNIIFFYNNQIFIICYQLIRWMFFQFIHVRIIIWNLHLLLTLQGSYCLFGSYVWKAGKDDRQVLWGDSPDFDQVTEECRG